MKSLLGCCRKGPGIRDPGQWGKVTVKIVPDVNGYNTRVGYQGSQTRISDLYRPVQKLQKSCLVWIQTSMDRSWKMIRK